MFRKIKLHYPTVTVIEATLRGHLPPKPGDVVLVFDLNSSYISNITILFAIDVDATDTPFVAPIRVDGGNTFHWTYAYKVPEGYASVETAND